MSDENLKLALGRAARERDAARERAEKLEKQLATALCRAAAAEALRDAGVIRGAKAIEPHLLSRLRATDLETAPRVVALDAYGNPSERSPTQLIDELRRDPDFAGVFAAPRKNGSDGGTVAGPNPFKRGPAFNATQQAILIRDNPKLAERLKAEAAAQA